VEWKNIKLEQDGALWTLTIHRPEVRNALDTPTVKEMHQALDSLDVAEPGLLIITGFCGGLTTFSTFSAEVVTLLQQGRLSWAMSAIAIHVSGSLLMTLAGLASWQLLKPT